MRNEGGFIAFIVGAPWEVWAMLALGIGIVLLTAYLERNWSDVSHRDSEQEETLTSPPRKPK